MLLFLSSLAKLFTCSPPSFGFELGAPYWSRCPYRAQLPVLPRRHCRCRNRVHATAPEMPKVIQLPYFMENMVSGGNVLFPGARFVFYVEDWKEVERLRGQGGGEGSFVHLVTDAWSEVVDIGTVAVVQDVKKVRMVDSRGLPKEVWEVSCVGLERLRVQRIGEQEQIVRGELFGDEPADDEGEQAEELQALEAKLVATITSFVRLTVKTARDGGGLRQQALQDTLSQIEEVLSGRVEVQFDTEASVKPSKELKEFDWNTWFCALGVSKRREIVSYVALNLQDLSFMERKALLRSRDVKGRLQLACHELQHQCKELAAKGAIISALGRISDNPSYPS